jgi:leucyl aminopeptidase (aminopeptidase T)
MPGISEDTFLRTLSVDTAKLAELTNRLAERVARAKTAHVTTQLGTDIHYELGHPVTAIDGICEKPGELDFFPPGLFLRPRF